MKHGLKRFTRYVLVAALSVSLAVPTMAATKAEVQSQIEDLKNQQSELESQLAELKQNKSDTESYISELDDKIKTYLAQLEDCLLYTSPIPRDTFRSRMPGGA